jgi:low temperature requirement protein LtrA
VNEGGKRVSWVELYLDLIFVLAVGGLAHVIEAHPVMHSVWSTLGLFVTLWWTWIGFAVLYNRHGADTRADRLVFLAGSVPAGIAAIAIEPVSEGHVAAFALAMAVTRIVLSPREYLWLLTAWTVMCAALATTDAEATTERFKNSGL